MAPTINALYTGSVVTTANPTVSVTAAPAAGDIVLVAVVAGSTSNTLPSGVSGLGATWSVVPGGMNFVVFYVGTGATSSGTVTATAGASANGRVLRAYVISGAQAEYLFFQPQEAATWATASQAVLAFGFSQSSTVGSSVATLNPSDGAWTTHTEVVLSSTRRFNSAVIVPDYFKSHGITATSGYNGCIVLGSPIEGTTITARGRMPNASFQTATSDYTQTGNVGTVASSTEQAKYGTRSMKLNLTGTLTSEVYRNSSTVMIALKPSLQYTASYWVYSTSGRTAAALIRWGGSNGGFISQVHGTQVTIPASTWTQVTLTATAPNNAYYAYPGVRWEAPVSGDIWYVDGATFNDGSTPEEFWDGRTETAGHVNLFEHSTDLYPSVQVTEPASWPHSVVSTSTGSMVTTANPTVDLAGTPQAGDVLILCAAVGSTAGTMPTAVSGLGATWTRIPGGGYTMTVWKGTGATSSGTVTATATATTSGRVLRLFQLRGVTDDAHLMMSDITSRPRATTNQIAIGLGYSNSTGPISATYPDGVWDYDNAAEVAFPSSTFNSGTVRVPRTGSYTLSGTTTALTLIVGSPLAGYRIAERNYAYNPSLISSISGYAISGFSGNTLSTEQAYAGTTSWKVIANGAACEAYRPPNSTSIPATPVNPGTQYTGAVYVYCSAARTVAATMRLADPNGISNVTTVSGSNVTLAANTWTRLTVTTTPAATKTWAGIGYKTIDAVSGDLFYTDAWTFSEGPTAPDYWDGDTADSSGIIYDWDGASKIYTPIRMEALPAGETVISFTHRVDGAWVEKTATPKVWTGSEWVVKRPKYWNGSAWIDLL